MFRTPNLSSEHFASKWTVPTKDEMKDFRETNELGIKYANLPDGQEKEDLLLYLSKSFHGYLLKYLSMVVRGHLPPMNSTSGSEAVKFLNLLLPSGKDKSSAAYGEICRTLHLAFKQSTTDDIYDSLLMCLMRAIKKFDPHYMDKLKAVCGGISELCKGKPRREGTTPEFTGRDVAAKMGMDCNSYLRKLVKRGHIRSIADSKKKVIGYRRIADSWPPSESNFKSGPIGFTYAVQKYFRYYLHEHITRQMHSIESKEGMLQLDHRGSGDTSWGSVADPGLPHAEGSFTDTNGSSWAADTTLMNTSMDISMMDEDWIQRTDDKLFRRLEVKERHLLYLIYVKELSITQISALLDLDPKTVRARKDEIMNYLKAHANR